MKILRLLILLIGVVTLHPLCSIAGQITQTVTYDPSKLSITYDTIDGNAYARVKYEGLNSFNQTGHPELPCDVLLLSVPYNATNFSVSYDQTTFIDLKLMQMFILHRSQGQSVIQQKLSLLYQIQ